MTSTFDIYDLQGYTFLELRQKLQELGIPELAKIDIGCECCGTTGLFTTKLVLHGKRLTQEPKRYIVR